MHTNITQLLLIIDLNIQNKIHKQIHTQTHIQVIHKFFPVKFVSVTLEKGEGRGGWIKKQHYKKKEESSDNSTDKYNLGVLSTIALGYFIRKKFPN